MGHHAEEVRDREQDQGERAEGTAKLGQLRHQRQGDDHAGNGAQVLLQPGADLGVDHRPGGLQGEVLSGHELQDVLPVGAGAGVLHDHLRP
jgi:hypothetical protein